MNGIENTLDIKLITILHNNRTGTTMHDFEEFCLKLSF